MLMGYFLSLILVIAYLLSTASLMASQEKTRPAAPAAATQQQQPKPAGQEGPVELSSELVVLDVTVIDRTNHPVGNLEKEDFVIFEDGAQQQVSFFSREETPVSLGLVLDTSGTMRKKLTKATTAAMRLVRQSHPQDEMFVVRFTAEAELIQDFTKDIREIEYALEDLVAHGQTALLDAVYLSVEQAQKYGKHRRKAIVILTDGEDRDSYYTRDQALQALRGSDVQVYVIGFPEGLDEQFNVFRETGRRKMGRREKRARKLLDELSSMSGGRAFYPQALEELDSIAETIATDLRTQYTLGYYPTRQRDGTWRQVKVDVKSDNKRSELVARTRSGYYATKSGQPPAKGDSKQSQRNQ